VVADRDLRVVAEADAPAAEEGTNLNRRTHLVRRFSCDIRHPSLAMDWTYYWNILEKISTRYFFLAGLGFLIFYVLLRRRLLYRKIQSKFPRNSDYAREISYSMITMLIFAFVPVLIIQDPAVVRHTRYYRQIADHGWFYFWVAFPLLFLIHDAYFYWTHRLMHHRLLFRWFHRVHHRSTNPSPWAAYSFHPLEAVVESGIFPVFLFTLPVHPIHLFVFFFLMIAYNVYGHLGYELYPRAFNRHWAGRWINTSISHNQHHQYYKGNYGLYFTIWDRLMGTMRPDYDERFVEVKGRKAKALTNPG
jgi:lathosterol oxidase